jgi:hypothetical protein
MNKFKGNFYKRTLVVLFIFVFLFFFPVFARAGMIVVDPTATFQRELDMMKEFTYETRQTIWDKMWEQIKKIGSLTFQATLQTALNTLAFDAATWIGSGGPGQTPLFSKEYLTDFGSNALDSATAQFINTLSKEWAIDLCKPSFSVQSRIGLGLVQFNRAEFTQVDCGWQELTQNWTNEYEKWKSITDDPDGFLKKVVNMFDPASNDVGVALTLYTRIDEEGRAEKEKAEEQLKINQGWLDVRNIGGSSETPPGQAQRELQKADASQIQNLGKFTGNALVDATNIFVNQLAITAFNKYIRGGGLLDALYKKDSSSSSGLTSAEADPKSFSNQNYVVDSLKKVIKPRFDIRADFNVLSDLAVCLDYNNPMPNNCVIDNQFSQAVQGRHTIMSAIENGFINSNWVFDRNIDYRSGFNYRSLMILRKFRIIPVGWEEALTRAEQQTALKGYRYTLMDMISCFDPGDEYTTFSDGFMKSNFSSHAWCEGLVDPTWVLKAPLNYCKRQGFGGYLASEQLIEVPESIATSSIDIKPIIVSRDDNYCADEQSCIKERFDGTCEYYGYCTEEKRTWNFGQDSCSPVYNTCDAFTSASSGKKLALLKNTIDYGTCSSDNIGCASYSISGIYSTTTKQVSWDSISSIYFNGKAETCAANNEGCQEFIKINAGSGHNFLLNGGFENDLNVGGWAGFATSSNAYSGNTSIVLGAINPLNKNVTVASANHVIAGESYTLSFYSSCEATSTMAISSKIKDILPSDDFSYQVLNYTFPSNYSSNVVSFSITSGSGDCYVDDLKLERGITGTYYSDYRGNGLTYQKLIPDYLRTTCYENPLAANPDFRLKDNAPVECYNYARLCNFNEIGCNLFTSTYGIQTSAKALEKDYCPSQCVGYDVYVQGDTLFEGKAVEKMIPATATACSASNTGCTEFTNLDEVAAGGEGKEYYVNLRHCIKPAQGNCDNFYSWEGSNDSGYQLRSFRLEKSAGTTSIIPKVTKGSFSSSVNSSGTTIFSHMVSGVAVCSQTIYNLPVSSPNYNPDCREFYNQEGDIIYVLHSTSVTCSENCKPYRMTEKNIDATITTSADCSALNTANLTVSNWNASAGVCYRCLAGGRWDDTQGACIYQAIPGEGKTCSASANGCREYNGNSGNNIRIVSAYDFNDGLGDWTGAISSTESLNQGGKSMLLTATVPLASVAEVEIGNLVSEGSSYVLKFSAKTNQARGLGIHLTDNVNGINYFGVTGEDTPTSGTIVSITLPASSEWQAYQVSLPKITHAVSNDEKLKIALSGTGGDVYISDIVLLEVVDRYYLIKNSWNIPNICYYDTMNNYRGVNYNLGCQPYTDLTNLNHNLRQFSKLCSDSAVGCQMAIQTNNYNSIDSGIFNDANTNGSCDANEPDCVFVPADRFIPVVIDSSKTCSSANMGCSRFGKVISTNPYAVSQNIYQNVYVKNNPNNYSNILCRAGEVGCDSWSSSSGSGTMYFKDPGDNLCQWRKGADVNSNFAWYKKAVKKCKAGSTFTSNICSTNSDCSTGQTCELDNGDYLCPVDSMKTIGYGGASPVYQPGKEFGINWAGLCPLKDAGCTEYIDPLSSFSPNIILNSNFSDLDGDGNPFDLWDNKSGSSCNIDSNGVPYCGPNINISFTQENINVEPNKLYVLQTNGDQVATLKCDKLIYKLGINNILEVPGAYQISALSGSGYKVIFYSGQNNASCDIEYSKSSDSAPSTSQPGSSSINHSIEVKAAVLDYQLKQNLDFSGCNGQANLNNGCVVFNERAYIGSGNPLTPYASLNFSSSNYSNYSTCSGANCDANALIKVSPDRVCGKWLACYVYSYNPYTDEKTCLEMGECTAFNYDGSCFNFSKAPEGTRNYLAGRDLNASGYSVLGMDYLANLKQVGEDVVEFTFESGSDLGSWALNTSSPIVNPSIEKCLINKANSAGINNSNVAYPASGMGFIKVGTGDCGVAPYYYWISNSILGNFTSGGMYYFSALVNTSDLSFNEKAKIDIVSATDISDSGGSIEIGRNNGWQEISFEFTYKSNWNNGLKIILGTQKQPNIWVSTPVYFDDIRIEPVLETNKVDKKFIPATCRLYPTQDSLMCESENRNFISSGWYGYCLQKDPANPDVCLMWYPLDSVKGKKGASSSLSSFTGYPDTSSKPYYCAEMSADFEMLEYRRGFLLSSVSSNSYEGDPLDYFNVGYAILAPPNGPNGCPSPGSYMQVKVTANISDNSINNIKRIEDTYCVPYNYDSSQRTRLYACNSTTSSGSPCKSITSTAPISSPWDTENNSHFRALINNGDIMFYPEDPNTILPTIQRNSSADPGWQFIKGSVVTGGSNGYQYFLLINNAGWYKYNGFGNYVEVSVVDGNHKTEASSFSEKDSGVRIWDYSDAASKFKKIEDYSPKCTKIVQGEAPWVQRLKSSTYSVGAHEYYSDPSHFAVGPQATMPLPDKPLYYYNLSTPGAPFGAIVNSGAPLSDSSTVFAGIGSATLASGGKYYGLPYSCNSAGRTVFNNNSYPGSCAFLYFDNGVKVFNPANDVYSNISERNYWEMQVTQPFNFKDYLKQLFLKVVSIKGTSTDAYDYTAGTANAIGDKVGSRDHETDYIAVRPIIATSTPNEVRLTNAIGVPVNKDIDVYEVESAGFYTLSFNTIVDLEQVPLSEVIVRMKKSGTSWTANEGFVKLSNIDPVPPESGGAHKVFRYLTPGDYNILIKAKDNWGFYNCVGLSGFVGAVAGTPCSDCCVKNEFLDKTQPSLSSDACVSCQ